jgi:GT2 family glycosyltransferase
VHLVGARGAAHLTVSRPRVLLAITVYGGRSFVPRCLASAAGLATESVDLDVVVLDDASPDESFSAECAALCAELGLDYYRSPRNLGIVRNVNLGLRRALATGYDYCIVSNSDVVYPSRMVEQLVAAAQADTGIGAVMPWSNNASIYSLPNVDATRLGSQAHVDAVSNALAGEFGTAVVDIPTGISFAILITRAALEATGLMDPIFGRGYCEELDWSLRCVAAGFRVTLGLGCFVYHAGGGSTVPAGLVSEGETTVPANEAVIDLRYPTFRQDVATFQLNGPLPSLVESAVSAVVTAAARAHGYVVDIRSLPRGPATDSMVHCELEPLDDGGPMVATARWLGFSVPLRVDREDPAEGIRRILGGDPVRVIRRQRGELSDLTAAAFARAGVEVVDRNVYPERV